MIGVDTWLDTIGRVLDVNTMEVIGDHKAIVEYSWNTCIALYVGS